MKLITIDSIVGPTFRSQGPNVGRPSIIITVGGVSEVVTVTETIDKIRQQTALKGFKQPELCVIRFSDNDLNFYADWLDSFVSEAWLLGLFAEFEIETDVNDYCPKFGNYHYVSFYLNISTNPLATINENNLKMYLNGGHTVFEMLVAYHATVPTTVASIVETYNIDPKHVIVVSESDDVFIKGECLKLGVRHQTLNVEDESGL